MNNLNYQPIAVSVISNPIDTLQRRTINEAFHCSIFDVYGSKEVQHIAFECSQSNHHLHVLNDLRHVEILDKDLKPVHGEEDGTVYLTSFTNYIMPLIRYCIADRTHWINEKCKCGLPFPLIHRVTGRESDVITDKNGISVYAPCNFVYTETDSIKGYQFVVHDEGVVTMKLIPNCEYEHWEEGINRIRNFYDKEYAGRIDFTYELVDSIPHDDGKLRFIIHAKK